VQRVGPRLLGASHRKPPTERRLASDYDDPEALDYPVHSRMTRVGGRSGRGPGQRDVLRFVCLINQCVDRALIAVGPGGRVSIPVVGLLIGDWGVFESPRPGEVLGWDHAVAILIGALSGYLLIRVLLGYRAGRW
jgi:hypothetical protein